MENKVVAKHALGFIGGKPHVDRFYNDNEDKKIDIMSSESGEIKGIPTCATIGLHETDLELTVRGKKLSVELIASGTIDAECQGNILSSIAFDIYDTHNCSYGMIIPNIIHNYVKKTMLKHVVLMSPVYWSKYTSLEDDYKIVSWLMVVPITDNEKAYIEANGIDAFDKLLEEQKIDILDFYRSSAV